VNRGAPDLPIGGAAPHHRKPEERLVPIREEKPEKLSIDHVERGALPWRDVELTECGLPVANHPVITRASYAARLREWGQQRTRFTVCRTCATTSANYQSWDENPVSAIRREAERCGWFPQEGDEGRDLFVRELRALAALAAAHPEEFTGYVQGLTETVSLDAARKSRRRKAT
jgi:hypothetical protein